MTALRLGLDVGTTAIKAAAYTPDGRAVAHRHARSETTALPGGRSEQDMDAVWATSCRVLSELTTALDGAPIAALGICGQGDGLWAIDGDGRPVGPAMLWNDTRAAGDIAALAEQGRSDAVGRACHTALWPGTSGALWRWLLRERPVDAARAAHVFTCPDWIGYRLTGEIGTDLSNASIPFLDLETRRYSPAALDALECGELAARLPAPRRATERLGRITARAAAATGLPEGLPVATPTLDLAAMIVGMGLERPGEIMMIMGTTAVVNILTDSVTPTAHPVGASAAHPTSDAIIRILAPTTGAAAFDWFAGLHTLSLGGEDSDAIAGNLNTLVETVPPGANGVTFLPYLNGERAPFVAPDLTAVFHGLTGRTSKADMGRAVMEGTAMSLRHCFAAEDGLPDRPVQLTGGGSRNPTWCQIIADVLGVPVTVSTTADQGLWGAAVLGAAAADGSPVADLVARQEDTVRHDPDMAAHRGYGPVFRRYRVLSETMQRSATDLARISAEPPDSTPDKAIP